MLDHRYPGLLANEVVASGLALWLGIRCPRTRGGGGALGVEWSEAVTSRMVAGAQPSLREVSDNMLRAVVPVHCPLPRGVQADVLGGLVVWLASKSSADWANLISVATQVVKLSEPWSSILVSKHRGAAATQRSRLTELLAASSRRDRYTGVGPAGRRTNEPLLLAPATVHVDSRMDELTDGESGAETTIGRRKRYRCHDYFLAAARELHRRATNLLGANRRLELVEVCRYMEGAMTRVLCGSVTRSRDTEGTESGGRLTIGTPSRLKSTRTGAAGQARGGLTGHAPLSVRSYSADELSRVARLVDVHAMVADLVSKNDRLALRQHLLNRFPRKAHPQAGAKCNVFLDSLLEDVRAAYPEAFSDVCTILENVPPGALYEDQVCNALVHAFSYRPGRGGLGMLVFLLLGLSQPARLKALSDVLKATGTSMDLEWAPYVELHCLLGRGVAGEPLEEDAMRRVAAEPYWAVDLDQTALASAIRHVLADELEGRVVQVDDLDRYWSRRYEWCVAGAHSHTTNHDVGFEAVPPVGPAGRQMTRRMAMEYTQDNPLHTWDGTTKVSVVAKLEQGKSRAIYSCNTASYVAFGRVLRPVERAWNGRRVILDPGAGGNYGMFRRIREAWHTNLPVALMLDYADFNSQHTLESQITTIRCLLDHCTGVTTQDADVLLESFRRMDLYLKGRRLGRVRRSLMSGHRGTSFINSVLNAAYIRLALGEERYARLQSFHVGDDVLIFCRSVCEANEILEIMRQRGFRLQAAKQSVGCRGFEFLRMAGDRRSAHGYLARAVASCVSGNWVTEWRDEPTAALHSLVHMARSIINRSANTEAWRLLLRSSAAVTNLPLEVMSEILSGLVAVGSGPVYRSDGRYESREILDPEDTGGSAILASGVRRLPRWATHDYFEEGCCDLERRAMFLAGFKPWSAALRSTYGDLAGVADSIRGIEGPDRVRMISLGARTYFAKSGEVVLDAELQKTVQRGVLVQYPIISLLQHALTDAQVGELLRAAGHLYEPGTERIMAFGGVREGAVVRGWLPYSDAAALGTRALPSAVRVPYPLYM